MITSTRSSGALAARWIPALLLSLFGLGSCGDDVRLEEIEVGLQGPARHNPYLAAEFLARELGYESKSVRRLQALPPTDWVLLVHQEALGSLTQLEGLFDWVGQGGRLWISGVPALSWDSNGPPEAGSEHLRQREAEGRLRLMLDWIQRDLSTWEDEEELPTLTLRSLPDVAFDWPGPYSIGTGELQGLEVAGTSDSAALLRMQYNEGQVELFAGLHGFDTHHLRDADRAQLFAHLLEHPDPASGLMVLYGKRSGFFAMLWARAWPLIVLFGAWLIFWLWQGLRRFGPVEQDPHWDPDGEGVGRRREFTEHLDAAARHYQQVNATQTLTDSALSLRGARDRRDPNVAPEAMRSLSLRDRMQRIQSKLRGHASASQPLSKSSQASPAQALSETTQTKKTQTSSNHAKS